jgi:phage gp36-like protein
MSFITRDDLLVFVKDEHLDDIISAIDLQTAITSAIALIRSYLGTLYDVDDIFSKRGDDRDLVVVHCCISIALRNVWKRLPNRKKPDDLMDYTETIALLERISDGKQPIESKKRVLADNSEAKAILFNKVEQRNV